MAIARLLVTAPKGRPFPPLDDLVAAGEAVEALDGLMDGLAVSLLKADLFSSAAHCAAGTQGLGEATKILGVPMTERDLRRAAEDAFRVSARQAKTDLERYALVDQANEVRPVTWV
jgi:serine/threonine-protein kinase PknG